MSEADNNKTTCGNDHPWQDEPNAGEMTRDALARIARIIGPSSASARALSDMDRIEAEGDHALCVRRGTRLVVIRVYSNDPKSTEATLLGFLTEEHWIPDWSAWWPFVTALQRDGKVRIRWDGYRSMVSVIGKQVHA